MTPTEANRIARWLQVLLILLQALGSALKVVPRFLGKVLKTAKR